MVSKVSRVIVRVIRETVRHRVSKRLAENANLVVMQKRDVLHTTNRK